MGTTQPIKNKNDIQRLKGYFLQKGEIRNYTMITLALNTSLRIGDLLNLKWQDVYNFDTKKYKHHIVVQEQKTHKQNTIPLNIEAKASLDMLMQSLERLEPSMCIFKSRIGENQHIGRTRAFSIKMCIRDRRESARRARPITSTLRTVSPTPPQAVWSCSP